MAHVGIDIDYWISHSEGFQVSDGSKRLGFVQEVLDGGHTLAVRGGFLGRRLVYVPVDRVLTVVPREQRMWLSSSPLPRAPRASTPALAEALSPAARIGTRHGERIAA
jgi:hypothetical protein